MQTYYAKKNILTENEKVFFDILRSILDLKYHMILCKVRLEDIVHVDYNLKNKDFGAFQSARGKIKAAHVDFVLCNNETQEIQAAIELDDWTHRKESAKEKDEQKDNILAEAGIKLFRIDCRDLDNVEKIRQILLN